MRKFDFRKCLTFLYLDLGGFVKIPGSEPIQLDLEKLFVLSAFEENLDVIDKA